jgi:glyoxylase-like metal-dependent hydrolase (beta-lactamase superfamily II)
MSRTIACALLGLALAPAAWAQTPAPTPPAMTRVAPDLYVHVDHGSSNSVVWVTAEGVLVVDTKQHPRQAQALVQEIRALTDKPIRWAFVTQAHGDHYLGNQVFKEAGATIVAQREIPGLMERYIDKELARRQRFFTTNNYDPKEIRLTLPDVTFERRMTIRLGGQVAHLIYLGPSQDPGNAFVHFPHARALATGGAYGTRSWANPMFTPSVDGWIAVLRQIKAMDVDVYLPGHGEIGTKQNVEELIGYLGDLQTAVRDAVARGASRDAVKALVFPQYRDWRNSRLAPNHLEALYHLATTGKSIYLDRE